MTEEVEKELTDAEKAASSITKRKNDIIDSKNREIEELKQLLQEHQAPKTTEESPEMPEMNENTLRDTMMEALSSQRQKDKEEAEAQALAKQQADQKEQEEQQQKIMEIAKFTHQNMHKAAASDEDYAKMIENPAFPLPGEVLMAVTVSDTENANAILKRALSDEAFNKALVSAAQSGDVESFVQKKLKAVYSSNPEPKESGVEKMEDLNADASSPDSSDAWDDITGDLYKK